MLQNSIPPQSTPELHKLGRASNTLSRIANRKIASNESQKLALTEKRVRN